MYYMGVSFEKLDFETLKHCHILGVYLANLCAIFV